MGDGFVAEAGITAAEVKAIALEKGADLVGIASAATVNAHPPDRKYPQTIERNAPDAKSVVVIAKRVPVAAYRCKSNITYSYMNRQVIRRVEKIAYAVCDALERRGVAGFVPPSSWTIWELKMGTYGPVSFRHLAVEAGLGTLGLEVNLLTPEYGPRVNLEAVIVDAELEPDQPMTEQVCIGESCSRCLYSCPVDAVRHFGLSKKACMTAAQVTGFPLFAGRWRKFATEDRAARERFVRSKQLFAFWQGLTQVVGSYGTCPRCLEVCPVGNDYHTHLAAPHKAIPEVTDEKRALVAGYKKARKEGGDIPGLNEWNRRWIGPEGYKGIVARQLQAFKRRRAAVRDGDPS
jgi:epoxyqueuosine reductase QueG